MTNYNERLDGILTKLDQGGYLGEGGVYTARTAITSLIKELVAEAKPTTMPSNLSPENYEKCERAVNQYHQNLLKALEEA